MNANFKMLGNNGATADNRDGQTTYLTADNLGVKVTVLADTGSYCSPISRSAVEYARKRDFPFKVELLPEPIMCYALLCKVKNENAVGIICRRFPCNFLRES
jgi:hypothetical protein